LSVETLVIAEVQNGVQNFPGSWGKER
jgi:hypothetical protein